MQRSTWHTGALLAVAAALTCGGLDRFDVTKKATTTVPGSALGGLLGSVGFGDFASFDLSQSTEFQNQSVSKDDVDSVHVKQLTLEAPAGSDFTFLDSLEFYVEAPGLERQRIAYGGPFPAGSSHVELQLDDVDLAPYVFASSMSVTTDAHGRPPASDTTITATLVLTVDVNVSGVAGCGG